MSASDSTLLKIQSKEQPLWLASAVAKVQVLADMPEGWDGHSSRPIQPTSIANMLRILNAIANADVPPPHIAPISGGALQIEWSLKNHDLEIVTRSDGSIHYLQTDNDDVENMQDGVLVASDNATLLQLLDWLIGR